MPIPKPLEQYLKKNSIRYDVVAHKIVFTAYDLAATLREKMERIGKTLLIRTDTGYVLVVLPANRRLDFGKLTSALGVKKVSLVNEKEMVKALKVKAGALTAFGALHKAAVFVDSALAKASDALVSSGSFTDSIRVKMKDFLRLENAKTGNVSIAAQLPPIQKGKKEVRKKGKKAKGRMQKSRGKMKNAKRRKTNGKKTARRKE